jgi:hypothetical protein
MLVCMKHGVMVVVLTACMLSALPLHAEEALKVSWSNLVPQVEFDDPFETLPRSQLLDLSIVSRAQSQAADEANPASEALKEKAQKSREKLTAQGVDVDGLLAKRDAITALRKKKATEVNEQIAGKLVKVPGYALPLEFDDKKITEFLLVPWVGACIHTPPPPPNQIISVQASEALLMKSRYEPVIIEGILKGGDLSKDLFLVDGTSTISISYVMQHARVTRYDPEKE